MADDTDYTPPAIWTWDAPSGGKFASINRPIAGATHDRDLNLVLPLQGPPRLPPWRSVEPDGCSRAQRLRHTHRLTWRVSCFGVARRSCMPKPTPAHPDTTPYWSDSASISNFPTVERDERVDVIVVGGGLTGLTAAYLLTAAGKTVAVLERQRCAQIDTGHTTAHLTMVTDLPLSDLVQRFGRDHAQAAWDAGLAAISRIDSIIQENAITCGFEWVDGYLHTPLSEGGESASRFEEDAALASDLGFDAVFVKDVPFVGGPGIRFDRQARFHPRKYLAVLPGPSTPRAATSTSTATSKNSARTRSG